MSRRVGRYLIYETIASGGMATVHVGRMVGPMGFSRTVAVKCLLPHFAQDGEFAAMLLDEARVSARIQHPFVVPTLDVVAEAGELLVVMEYVHGESLAKLRKRATEREQPIDPSIAATIMTQVLHGLHAAHEVADEHGDNLGVVHRDVSPQNILVGADGVARVLDFGIAKALGRAQTTREGQIKGKLAYMSPEQVQGDPVDRRTDVFAASIVLWELLTGERLFATDDQKVTIGKVIRCEVTPPSLRTAPTLNPRRRRAEGPSANAAGTLSALDEVVLHGLAREPAQRYATADEMARALEAAVTPAPASKVAAWVDSLCHDDLAARRARIAEIERSGETAHAVVQEGTGEPTKSAHTISMAVDIRHRRRWTWAVPIALVAAGALTYGAFGRRSAGTPLVTDSAKPTLLASASATSSASPLETAAMTPAASTAAAVPASQLNLPSVARPTIGHTPPVSGRGHAVPGASGATLKANCTPPYVLDDQGHKHYKRECLVE